MKDNNKETVNLYFLNIRNCAGYGFDTQATNYCPPKAPWWDDGKYPDLEDFGNIYNPWLSPWYVPQIPSNEFEDSHHFIESSTKRKKHKDSEFKPYPGEPGYNSGYYPVPYFPYLWPNAPKETTSSKEHDCCCCYCDDDTDSAFKPYPGEPGYNSGYRPIPSFPYLWPNAPKETTSSKEHDCCCCCCDDDTDSEFKPYPGEPGYNSGYRPIPSFPYLWPN